MTDQAQNGKIKDAVTWQSRDQSQNAAATEVYPAGFRQCESILRGLPLRAKWGIFWRILASSSYRFVFRIRSIQAYSPVDYGPGIQFLQDEEERALSRTDARIQSTDNLLAKHRWADVEDVRIFLEGFDAGERWLRDTLSKQSQRLSA